jgi:hypothetical protein
MVPTGYAPVKFGRRMLVERGKRGSRLAMMNLIRAILLKIRDDGRTEL